VLAGFAGIASELNHQREVVAKVLPAMELLDGDRAVALYSSLRDLYLDDDAIAARMAVLPNDLARCAGESSAEFVAHLGSGIAELWTRDTDPSGVERWRDLAHSARGHLRVLSAPSSIRSQLEYFDRPNAGASKLMQRLKTTFDPAGVFNPGCLV
jgi:glycolate oxidase FAD binding subunit